MSKSNDSSKLGRATQVRELRPDELEKVTGGFKNCCAGSHYGNVKMSDVIDGTSNTLLISQ